MLNQDAFTYIEVMSKVQPGVTPGVTADMLSKKMGGTPATWASWLSKWAKRGFLRRVPPESGGVKRLEELEHLETIQRISPEDLERLRALRAWKLKNFRNPGRSGRPSGFQSHYILGKIEWASYAHGKLEERELIRSDVGKW